MQKKVKCWEVLKCNDKECPVYKAKELNCWLISGTHCHNEIQGKFLEKMEMCLQCGPFLNNMDSSSLAMTLNVVNEQFLAFRKMVDERDRELETISMELALGLSEVFQALKRISSGDPDVRIPDSSQLELITKLKQIVNLTAKDLADIVHLSHEFAIGLAEHFDVLNRVSKGDLTARVYGTSRVELLDALKKVTNQMIGSVSREITERQLAEGRLESHAAELEQSNRRLEEFAYVVSHDLQEPLRTVASYLRLLERHCKGKLDEDSNGYITFAIDGANRMYALIDELLGYSRVSNRGSPPETTHAEPVADGAGMSPQKITERS
jgi:signal transduction histidine kinase